MRQSRRVSLGRRLASLTFTGLIFAMQGCAATYAQRDPTGERFPTISGATLEEEPVDLPDAFLGQPVLLLVGYEQDTQFDIDRWLLGIRQAEVDVATRELPTVPGMLPGLFAGRIDSAMRKGIPEEDWAAVITVYEDADELAEFTGNANPLPARVLLLNTDGRVAFFHDEGYSVNSLMRMQETLEELR